MSPGARDTEFDWFLGIDWGTASHAVSLQTAAGEVVVDERVAHTRVDLDRFVAAVETRTGRQWSRVAVAIEIPRGAIVEVFLERGAAVFALNPKQLDRFRDRFSVAGAKSDELDARVLSSALRTDRACFRPLATEDPLVLQLREVSRADAVLAEELVALTHRLRELVHRIAPSWLTLSANADDPWFWALVEQAATSTLGHGLRRGKIQSLLRRYRVRRVSADEVLGALRTPPLTLAPGTIDAVATHIHLLVPRVRLVAEQRRTCARTLETVLDRLATRSPGPPSAPTAGADDSPESLESRGAVLPSDVAIVRSAPGVGIGVSAVLLAEANALLTARSYDGLRAVTGVAPVRRQTGKDRRGAISMRYACNTRLRNACYHWALNSIRLDAAAKTYYAALRARGHSAARALRSVADRWLRILVAMLKHRQLYNPSRFVPAPSPLTQPALA